MAQGEPGEAVAAYREAIRLKPDDALAHHNLGTMLGRQGRLGEAVAELREVIRLQPDDASAHNSLAFSLFEAGDLEGAMRSVRDALRIAPESLALTTLAEILLVRGRFAEALPALERAAAIADKLGRDGDAKTYRRLIPVTKRLAEDDAYLFVCNSDTSVKVSSNLV